jgi:hypothetical protein
LIDSKIEKSVRKYLKGEKYATGWIYVEILHVIIAPLSDIRDG